MKLAAELYLGALWLVCLYRAATQSIAHDEALTYELYLKGPPSQIFHYFHSNHHFLNTLLMYFSVSLFGVSEWSLRLPALAGALLGVGLLTLNPFILDFMVAARGYGMALGIWIWALLLPYLDDPQTRVPRARWPKWR